MPYNAVVPAYSRTDDQPIFGRKIFQDFAILCPEAIGRQTCRVVKQVDELRALKSQDPQFCKYLLLSNA